ncbi:hypothetical protein H4R18_002977 [Coemansia javaensis]|uniref:Uncharacterized protein n=1 Tax=Coemansia javaensis TaxID=2761396 RepID=A0A9W8HAL3_9FUNG|nr:hypothetical protein H4R18_002977 [Coemansia javaensis]
MGAPARETETETKTETQTQTQPEQAQAVLVAELEALRPGARVYRRIGRGAVFVRTAAGDALAEARAGLGRLREGAAGR